MSLNLTVRFKSVPASQQKGLKGHSLQLFRDGFEYQRLYRMGGDFVLAHAKDEGVVLFGHLHEALVDSKKLDKSDFFSFAEVVGDELVSIFKSPQGLYQRAVALSQKLEVGLEVSAFKEFEGARFLADTPETRTLFNDISPEEWIAPVFPPGFSNDSPHRLIPQKDLRFPSRKKWVVAAAAAFIGMVAVGVAVSPDPKPREVVSVVDPFIELDRLLTRDGINVKGRMLQIYNDLALIENLPGWRLQQLDAQFDVTRIELVREGGTIEELKSFAFQHGYMLSMLDGKYLLGAKVRWGAVLNRGVTMPLEGIHQYMIPALEDFIGDLVQVPSVPASKDQGRYSQQEVMLDVAAFSRIDLDTIGTLYNGFPVAFNSAQVTGSRGNTGLYAGNIKLIYVGSTAQ